MQKEMLSTGQKIAGIIGGVIIFCALLPWADFGIITIDGTSGGGIFTIGFGIIVVSIILLRDWNSMEIILTGLLGALTVVVAFLTYQELPQGADGIGLTLTLLSGIALTGVALYGHYFECSEKLSLQTLGMTTAIVIIGFIIFTTVLASGLSLNEFGLNNENNAEAEILSTSTTMNELDSLIIESRIETDNINETDNLNFVTLDVQLIGPDGSTIDEESIFSDGENEVSLDLPEFPPSGEYQVQVENDGEVLDNQKTSIDSELELKEFEPEVETFEGIYESEINYINYIFENTGNTPIDLAELDMYVEIGESSSKSEIDGYQRVLNPGNSMQVQAYHRKDVDPGEHQLNVEARLSNGTVIEEMSEIKIIGYEPNSEILSADRTTDVGSPVIETKIKSNVPESEIVLIGPSGATIDSKTKYGEGTSTFNLQLSDFPASGMYELHVKIDGQIFDEQTIDIDRDFSLEELELDTTYYSYNGNVEINSVSYTFRNTGNIPVNLGELDAYIEIGDKSKKEKISDYNHLLLPGRTSQVEAYYWTSLNQGSYQIYVEARLPDGSIVNGLSKRRNLVDQ